MSLRSGGTGNLCQALRQVFGVTITNHGKARAGVVLGRTEHCGRNNDATEQGVEADEAWSTSELRSLTPVFCGRRGRPWRYG